VNGADRLAALFTDRTRILVLVDKREGYRSPPCLSYPQRIPQHLDLASGKLAEG
jgi:hypothetical protein